MPKQIIFLILTIFTITLFSQFVTDVYAVPSEIFIPAIDNHESIAFDSAGNLYVADAFFDTVRQYDSAGNLLDADFAVGLSNIQSIAFDSAGNLYVADAFFDTVRQYDSAGNLLDADFAVGLSNPQSIAFDSAGNLYVADINLGTVQQYDSAGNLLDADFAVGLSNPQSIAFDSAGNLYVADAFFDTVQQYDSAGNLLDADFAVGLSNPQSIAFDSAGNLYVADRTGVVTTNSALFASSSTNGGGNGCKGDCTDPTIGLDDNGRRLVDNGFTYNDHTINTIDFHTPFPLISTQIGETNTVIVKAYDNIGPHGIQLVQFGLGVPEVGSALNDAEVIIEVWTTYSGIDVEKIVITDPYNLIENSSVVAHTNIVNCLENNNSADQQCIQVTMQHVYREAPIYNTMLVDVMDINRRTQTTSFNDGLEVLGESINPADTMHIGFAFPQSNHPEKSGAIDLIQTDRAQQLWVDPYGYIWQGNESKMTLVSDIPFERFQDSVSKFHEYNDRQNSNFAQYKQLQIEKAQETFDKLVFYKQIQNNDLTDYVAYTIDYTITKRADSPILQQTIENEKIRAAELLEQILAKTHRIHMMED